MEESDRMMDGVMLVADDKRGWRNEAGSLFQKRGADRNERFVILGKEDEDV